jgi:hypothetical protein
MPQNWFNFYFLKDFQFLVYFEVQNVFKKKLIGQLPEPSFPSVPFWQ